MRDRILLLNILLLLTMTAVAASKFADYTSAAKTSKFTLVIDAGHGGNDAGAIGAVTKEKYINLNVALAFGRLVERNCSDVKVIYTRKSTTGGRSGKRLRSSSVLPSSTKTMTRC